MARQSSSGRHARGRHRRCRGAGPRLRCVRAVRTHWPLDRVVVVEDDGDAAREVPVRAGPPRGVREDELDALEAFVFAPTWVGITDPTSRAAWALARRYRRSHSDIDVDYRSAATPMLLEADLPTTRMRHLPTVEGLRSPY